MYPDTCEEVENLGIQVIRNNRPKQAWLYLRTKCFITNDAFPAWAVRRPGQIWINTWHGAMNYKHIGYDYLEPMDPLAMKLFLMENRSPDFYLAGSRFFLENTSDSFRYEKSVFLKTGLPRNDVFFDDPQKIKAKVHAVYNIGMDKKIVLFAPTFRREMKSQTYGMDVEKVCNALHLRFGGYWVMLFRNHSFIKETQVFQSGIDVSAHHDMQELLCAADVLISDYSSCLYDFCMTGRPSFVYATDLEAYQSGDRDFAYPIEKWPYSVAESKEELVKEIINFDEMVFQEKVAEHLEDTGSYDDGSASEKVAELIASYCL